MAKSNAKSNGSAPVAEANITGADNRTGIALAPEMALDLIRVAQKTPPSPKGSGQALAEARAPYIKQKAPMGSKPLPRDGSDADEEILLLMDKLGERLAFERQGTRLYECLIGKVKAQGKTPGGPTVQELEHILEEEIEHFRFLQRAIVAGGGDPTAVTPCANVAAVLSQGIVQIVSDPRSTVTECLEEAKAKARR